MQKWLFCLVTLFLIGNCSGQNKITSFEEREDSLFNKYFVGLIENNNYIYYSYENNDVFISANTIYYLPGGKDSVIVLKDDTIIDNTLHCKLMNTEKTREFLKKIPAVETYSPLGFIYYFEKSNGKKDFSFYLPLSHFWGKEKEYDCFIQSIYSLTVYLYAINKS